MVELIYCADGNARYAGIALKHNFTYGAQMPRKVHFKPDFIDQDWKKPDRDKYMQKLQEHNPRMATVLDLEHESQFDDVMAWAHEASAYVQETIIIIPKVSGVIDRIPTSINGKSIVLGYSVPTSYGGTNLMFSEFNRRPVHLLGGNPLKQVELSHYMNVVSADTNYHQKISTKGVVTSYGYPVTTNFYTHQEHDLNYTTFELSCMNIKAMWTGSRIQVRWALEKDLTHIQRIAKQYKNELGFVMNVSLKESIARGSLLVGVFDGAIVGFVNYRACRDGWQTIYEIAIDKTMRGRGLARGLIASVPTPIRLKTTTDNDVANKFYLSQGFILDRVEQGRKRPLNVYKKTAHSYTG